MGYMEVKIPVSDDIYDVRSSIESVMDDVSGSKVSYSKNNDNNVWMWDNENLKPGYKHVSSRQRVYNHLKTAKDNNRLERVHEYSEPLACGVKATGGMVRSHHLLVEAYDLSLINLLCKGENTRVTSNYKEIELWTWFCKKSHIKDYKSECLDRIENKISK